MTQYQSPIFSVVVPFLNEERWLPGCIDALQRQTLDREKFELIFVDNGSTDRSREILSRFPDITVLSESRRDPYLARNRGIAAAQGTFIAFLDADCMADPHWLQAHWDALQHSEAMIVIGYLAHPKGASVFVRCHEDYYDQKLKHLIRRGLRENYFGHAGNMIVRTEVFRTIGSFQTMPIVGDSEIIHRLFEHRPEAVVLYADQARVVHAEVERFRTYLSKLYECGEYSETLARVSPYRPIPAKIRWRIMTECVREKQYGIAKRLAMIAALGLGLLNFAAGQKARSWSSRRNPFATAARERTAIRPS